LEESLVRGQAFEELIRSTGWEFIKNWYQKKIQTFATSLLVSDQKGIIEFENERRELIGLRKLMGVIDNDLNILHKYEEDEKAKKSTGKSR
jgi:hypothetical protein